MRESRERAAQSFFNTSSDFLSAVPGTSFFFGARGCSQRAARATPTRLTAQVDRSREDYATVSTDQTQPSRPRSRTTRPVTQAVHAYDCGYAVLKSKYAA